MASRNSLILQMVAIVSILAIVLSACNSRPEEALSIRTLTPIEGVEPLAEGVLTKEPDNDHIHSVLAISAGGAEGAYGAGVLAGWSKQGSRPEFDVVTGVSTGALMAVFAFLGEPYDPVMSKIYTSQTDKDVYRKRGIGALSNQSFYDNTPLKHQIELYVDEETLQRVAAQHDRGRRLYVATTNLDNGSLVIWDMGKIAKGNRSDKVLHFQKVLRASTAVPGFFDPVYIKPVKGKELRQAHVDGGVKAPILLNGFMLDSKLGDKQVFMIVNSNTSRYNASKPIEANVKNISLKAISELIRKLTTETIFHGYVLAKNANAKFRLTAIPEDFPPTDDSLKFDPKRMQALYDAGYKDGLKGAENWLHAPKRLSRLELQ